MQAHFLHLAESLNRQLQGDEVLTCLYNAEATDFVRFNHSKIRQAGHVQQQTISLDLINGQRHAGTSMTLSGATEQDSADLLALLHELRTVYTAMPEDPFLLYAQDINNSVTIYPPQLPASSVMVETILAALQDQDQDQDMVGILASGTLATGFANSLGQCNWHSRQSFNLDWSLYGQSSVAAKQAVKARYAGFEWCAATLHEQLQQAQAKLALMGQSPRNLTPGRYRCFFAPQALEDILQLLTWGGFGLRAQRTGGSALVRMLEQGLRLHPAVTLQETTAQAIAADFQAAGFLRPAEITFIERGQYKSSLVSPRSALEYQQPCNGAEADETPLALTMAAGDLASDQVLAALDTGLYIGNVWYLNYSDRNAGRMTGMTRFATFWVENGKIVAPVQPLRFDETIYNLLGERLLAITGERELLLDPGSYGSRSKRSAYLPGILVDAVMFTL